MGLDSEVTTSSHPAFHPGRTAAVSVGGRVIGHIGELDPRTARALDIEGRVAAAEVDLAPILEPVPAHIFRSPSTFPHVDFDLSFLVADDLAARALVDATSAAGDDLVESTRVFDEFHDESVGQGMKALAIRYRLRAPDRTLDATEIGTIREQMIGAATELGARLRGAE
jgi:phenylalanyl-tRNA synthetase beta chain